MLTHTRILPLYQSSHVVVKVGSTEYKLPKALLCQQSAFFAAAFEGEFIEGKEERITLQEETGVVSDRSFRCMVQWLLIGQINFGHVSPEQGATDAVEFARLADMLEVFGMENLTAQRIESIIKSEQEISEALPSPINRNTLHIHHEHIVSGIRLPGGHPVRRALTRATVEGLLQSESHKFAEQIEHHTDFALDVLRELQATLESFTCDKRRIYFEDPIRGDRVQFVRRRRGSADSIDF